MDNRESLPPLDGSINGGYDIRFLVSPDEKALLAPALTVKFLRASGYDRSMGPLITSALKRGVVALFEVQDAPIGFILFDWVGIRDAAQVHITWWGGRPALRVEALRRACEYAARSFGLLRLETYIDAERRDLCALAEAVGGKHVGTIPSGWYDPVTHRRVSQELYVMET